MNYLSWWLCLLLYILVCKSIILVSCCPKYDILYYLKCVHHEIALSVAIQLISKHINPSFLFTHKHVKMDSKSEREWVRGVFKVIAIVWAPKQQYKLLQLQHIRIYSCTKRSQPIDFYHFYVSTQNNKTKWRRWTEVNASRLLFIEVSPFSQTKREQILISMYNHKKFMLWIWIFK